MSEVLAWLSALRLEAYSEAFRQQGFHSLASLASLSSDDLNTMGITLQGHRTRILKHLPTAQDVADAAQQPDPKATEGLDAVLGDLAQLNTEIDEEQQPQDDEIEIVHNLPDADLDALLNDLCAFGEAAATTEPEPEIIERVPSQPASIQMVPSEPIPAAVVVEPLQPVDVASPAPPPQSSAHMRRKTVKEEVMEHLTQFGKRMSAAGKISQQDLDNLMKEEKIRIAMQKLAAAQLQEVTIKVHLDEGTSKTIPATLPETTFEVIRKLVVKYRMEDNPNWVLVEVCPTLHLQRNVEDHESVVEVFNAWPPSGDYLFHLRLDPEKFALFVKPDKFFPPQFFADLAETAATSSATAEKAKRMLLQEYFSSTQRLPDVKGYVHSRDGPKKWKKCYCVLRASGIYVSAKGESEASKDLQMLIKFDENVLCLGNKATEHYKAPTDFCLFFRPNIRKRLFDQADIQAVCLADEGQFNAWFAAVRMALFGSKLKASYDETLRKFDKLVEMGATDPKAKEGLVNKELNRMVARKAKNNSHLIQKWLNQRVTKGSPNVSAATGVEFDLSAVGGKNEGSGSGGASQAVSSGGAGMPAQVAVPPEVAGLVYYHGGMERAEAEALFAKLGFPTGYYLLRNSSSRPNDFVLTACFQGKVFHYQIKRAAETRWTVNDRELFASVPALVERYRAVNSALAGMLTAAVPRA